MPSIASCDLKKGISRVPREDIIWEGDQRLLKLTFFEYSLSFGDLSPLQQSVSRFLRREVLLGDRETALIQLAATENNKEAHPYNRVGMIPRTMAFAR